MNLDFLHSSELNQVSNYFREALEIQQFLHPIETLRDQKYEHEDIFKSVRIIDQFLQFLRKIYNSDTGLPTKDFAWRVIKQEKKDDWDWQPKDEDNSTLA